MIERRQHSDYGGGKNAGYRAGADKKDAEFERETRSGISASAKVRGRRSMTRRCTSCCSIFPGCHSRGNHLAHGLLVALIAIPAHSGKFLRDVVKRRMKTFNMDTVAIGTTPSFYSLYEFALCHYCGHRLGADGLKIADLYFEVAVFLITFVLMGKWLEARARKNKRAIKKLMGLQAKPRGLIT